MTAQSFLAGQILLLDKPLNWSSFQAVNKLKYQLKRYSPELKKIKCLNSLLFFNPIPKITGLLASKSLLSIM
jgi:hypothetical protein